MCFSNRVLLCVIETKAGVEIQQLMSPATLDHNDLQLQLMLCLSAAYEVLNHPVKYGRVALQIL